MATSNIPSPLQTVSFPEGTLPIPPRDETSFLHTLLETEPGRVSPRSMLNVLSNYDDDEATIPRQTHFLLARRTAESAVYQLEAAHLRTTAMAQEVNDLRLAAEAVRNKHALELDDLRQEVLRLNHRVAAPPECPEGYVANIDQCPDFIINYEDGQTAVVPFIRSIPGASYVLGTFGGPNDPIFTHELYAQPRTPFDVVPDILPNWFTDLISRDNHAYATVIAEAQTYEDWGLVAEIERYHRLHAHNVAISDQIDRLQAEQTQSLHETRASHFRLARAEVGTRLAYLEALDPEHQQGYPEGRPHPFPFSKRKGKGCGRPFA